MIRYTNVSNIDITSLSISTGNAIEQAFPIYLNLLNDYQSEQLLLLESGIAKSIESRVSIIGIHPVLRITVTNVDVTIWANAHIQKRIKNLYANVPYVELGADKTRFQLQKRADVWGFLRVLDDQFKVVDGGVHVFSAFAYSTIYFIEEISGYQEGDIADIELTCYSNIIEFTEDGVIHYEYGFEGANPIQLSILEGGEIPLITPPAVDDHFTIDSETSKSSYLEKANSALEHVRMGDVYQIQIGHKVHVTTTAKPLEVYARLRLLNPSPYMYLFHTGSCTIIGASPESFIYMDGDTVTIRPIAGTLGKSSYPSKAEAQQEFSSNEKEIAEHLMLVDLCRNDLSKVSNAKSLKVTELMSVQEYSHVYHLISTAKACISHGLDKYDVIKAAFPAGTMTGTPKIRAIELIHDLEDSDRGLYAGSLGMMTFGRNYVNTALCIRTAVEQDGVYTMRASAGIVSDSKVESEYAETLHKMASVFKAITNQEIACHIV